MVHFLATNTITLITTEIGQNVFSIVANVPLMYHSLALILMLTFSLELQEKQIEKTRRKGWSSLSSTYNYGENLDGLQSPWAPKSVLSLNLMILKKNVNKIPPIK